MGGLRRELEAWESGEGRSRIAGGPTGDCEARGDREGTARGLRTRGAKETAGDESVEGGPGEGTRAARKHQGEQERRGSARGG